MNPQKQENKITLHTIHRIIVVVYIPELTGYYQNILQVFKLCLESIMATKNNQCAITVVNNASCKEVFDFLEDSFRSGKIDSVIHHKENIGKIDALIGAARGAREELITMTDVDILFKMGWQENVENIFQKVKNVGSVSPIAVRKSINYGTGSTLKNILFRKVRFSLKPIPQNFEDYNRYLQSINWSQEISNNKLWPVIEENGVKAILGSGHQVLTIRREILFITVPTVPSLTLVGGHSEFDYVDEPINKAGGMRLATFTNFAYHMGNNVEDWMLEIQDNNIQNKGNQNSAENPFELPITNYRKPWDWWFYFSNRVYIKIFNFIYRKRID